MKHFTFNFKWLVTSLLLCIGSSAWGQSTTYTTGNNITWTHSNGVVISRSTFDACKIAKGSSTTITIPAGTKKLYVHCAAWNKEGANLSISASTGVTISPTSWTITADAGVSGNSTNFTLSTPKNASSAYYKEFSLSGVSSASTITFTCASNKRAVIWGINALLLSHSLTYSATNGTISGVDSESTAVASGGSVAEGATVTLTATPASGYAFKEWSVTGKGSTLSSTSSNPTTFTMGTANSTVTAVFEASTTVANPTFTVSEGTYNEEKSVELNCETDGATIYYTTDGTAPTSSSTEYTGAIDVNETMTIKAIAIKAGLTDSEVASATYTLQCATPEITVPAGAFLDSKVITMTSTDGATIYYTTDGSVPTNSSTPYDSANKPSIIATTTFKAIAIKAGWSDSEVASETFTKIVPLTVAEVIAMAPTSTSTPAKGQSDIYVTGYIIGEFRNITATNTTVLTSDFTTDANIALADSPTTTALASSIPVNLTSNNHKDAFGNKTNKGKTIGYKVLVKGDALKYFSVPGLKNIDEISAVSVPATLGTNGYTTFASTYPLDLTAANLPTGVEAYKASVEGTTVTFTEIDQTVPANTGILLKGTANETVAIPVAASGTAVEGNAFLVNEGGSTFAAESGYNYFGLKKGTLTFALFDPSAVAIPANKAYLKVAESAGVKSLNVVFDEATGISTLERVVIDNEAWYDLQGRRVAQPTKGIYIHNGKKVFIK